MPLPPSAHFFLEAWTSSRHQGDLAHSRSKRPKVRNNTHWHKAVSKKAANRHAKSKNMAHRAVPVRQWDDLDRGSQTYFQDGLHQKARQQVEAHFRRTHSKNSLGKLKHLSANLRSNGELRNMLVSLCFPGRIERA